MRGSPSLAACSAKQKKRKKEKKRSNLERTCLAAFPQWEPVPGERLRVEVPPHGAKGKREGAGGRKDRAEQGKD